MCVLGATNERYEALYNVRMYVCMCLRLSVNYGQMIGVFVFFHKRVGQYGFKDSKSRRTAKLHDGFKSYNNFTAIFSKTTKTSNVGMWDVYPEALDCKIALCSQISFWVSVSEEKALSEPKNLQN